MALFFLLLFNEAVLKAHFSIFHFQRPLTMAFSDYTSHDKNAAKRTVGNEIIILKNEINCRA